MNVQKKMKWKQIKNYLLLVILLATTAAGMYGCEGSSKEVSLDNSSDNGQSSESIAAIDYVYGIPMDENAAVISESVADIYSSPDVKSTRITQTLYNQPVRILQREAGWVKVNAIDGSSGWMKLKFIDNDVSSVYGRSYTNRVIVTSKEKSIYSSPTGGITQMNAPMGSEFFSFNSSGEAYEVFLPGNKTGWIKGSGIIQLGKNEMVPVTNADDFASTALRFKGSSYLLNGMSGIGIDAPGLVYICARINGIDLPRSIDGQMASGTEIKPEEAQAGDLVFLAGLGEGEIGNVTCVGISIGSGNYVYAGRKTGYVAVGDIKKDNAEGSIVAARRIFN